MTLLVDISCPDCGRTDPVRKRDLGRYYCEACDRTFTESAVPRVPDLGPPSGDDPPDGKDSSGGDDPPSGDDQPDEDDPEPQGGGSGSSDDDA